MEAFKNQQDKPWEAEGTHEKDKVGPGPLETNAAARIQTTSVRHLGSVPKDAQRERDTGISNL